MRQTASATPPGFAWLREMAARRATLSGHPPRLVKLSLGNCSSDQVLAVLLRDRALIESMFADERIGVVELVLSDPA